MGTESTQGQECSISSHRHLTWFQQLSKSITPSVSLIHHINRNRVFVFVVSWLAVSGFCVCLFISVLFVCMVSWLEISGFLCLCVGVQLSIHVCLCGLRCLEIHTCLHVCAHAHTHTHTPHTHTHTKSGTGKRRLWTLSFPSYLLVLRESSCS